MTDFHPYSSLLGGVLIALGLAGLLFGTNQVIGISGVVAGALQNRGDRLWRLCFLAGMLATAALYLHFSPHSFDTKAASSLPMLVLSGLLVGFGTRLSGGCTSGHGVCGIGRFSPRSLVATLIFIATGAIAATLTGFLVPR